MCSLFIFRKYIFASCYVIYLTRVVSKMTDVFLSQLFLMALFTLALLALIKKKKNKNTN